VMSMRFPGDPGKRMDITIAPGQLLATATLIDVTITAVTTPTVLGAISAREKEKHTKYGSLYDASQTLVPVVFSPLGSVNVAGAEILKKICAASASRENATRVAGRTLLGIYSVLAAGVARSLSLGMIDLPVNYVDLCERVRG
jgi:predicted benzoate:H+ symporter BenE